MKGVRKTNSPNHRNKNSMKRAKDTEQNETKNTMTRA